MHYLLTHRSSVTSDIVYGDLIIQMKYRTKCFELTICETSTFTLGTRYSKSTSRIKVAEVAMMNEETSILAL